MELTNFAELVHTYEANMLGVYDDFLVASRNRDKKGQSTAIRKFLSVIRSLNRDLGGRSRSQKVSLSGSDAPPEWFSNDANQILQDMWNAKAIEELAITLLKALRKKSPSQHRASITAQIEATKAHLRKFLRVSKGQIQEVSPDFWNDAYEKAFRKYLTR